MHVTYCNCLFLKLSLSVSVPLVFKLIGAGCYVSLVYLLKLSLLQIVSVFKIRLAFFMN